MGGKNYFCDYCSCYMKNDRNMRKVHNSGLAHKIAKATYMRRFEDPKQILANESAKAPCTRYPYCRFDLFCKFSHYNEKQMQQLRKIVYKLELKTDKKPCGRFQANEMTNVRYFLVAAGKKVVKRLPPSLQPINFYRMHKQGEGCTWG